MSGALVRERVLAAASTHGWTLACTSATRTEVRRGRWSVVVRWSTTGAIFAAGLYEHTIGREHVGCVRDEPLPAVLRWLATVGGAS